MTNDQSTNDKKMKLFASWSGGKDCMLALYRVQQAKEHEISYLVNMCDTDGKHSRSHGLKKQVIAEQAKALNIPIIQKETDIKSYENRFKDVIAKLKESGVEGGIFGDIYLEEHRVWIERVCREMEIEAIFPLWENDTLDLLNEFINLGFKALTVSVNKNMLAKEWLNRNLDAEFANEISQLEGIDPCAENGEYHSFVFDGPNFSNQVNITKSKVSESDTHWFQKIELAK